MSPYGVQDPALHATLGKSAKRCIWVFFLRNYTAVVHRKDIFLSNCLPYYFIIGACLSAFDVSTVPHSFYWRSPFVVTAAGKPWKLTTVKAQDIKDALDLVFKLNSEKNCFPKTLTFVSNMFGNNVFIMEFH